WEGASPVAEGDEGGQLGWGSVAGVAVVQGCSVDRIGQDASPGAGRGDASGHIRGDGAVAGQLTGMLVDADQRRVRDGDVDGDRLAAGVLQPQPTTTGCCCRGARGVHGAAAAAAGWLVAGLGTRADVAGG